jgi:hypothetical protein
MHEIIRDVVAPYQGVHNAVAVDDLRHQLHISILLTRHAHAWDLTASDAAVL